MNKLKIFHIDDDETILLETKKILSKFPDVELIGSQNSISKAIEKIESSKPDVLLLDIKINDSDIFNLLNISNLNLQVIFLTGYSEYAIKAYQVGATYYLLKPAPVEEFKKAFEIAKKNILLSNYFDVQKLLNSIKEANTPKTPQKVVIVTAGKTFFEDITNIEFLKADGSCTKFYLTDGSVITSGKLLKHYRAQFIEYPQFFEISRSAMINMEFVKAIIRNKSKSSVQLLSGQIIPVSLIIKNEFLTKLDEFNFNR